jgi:hypothetical protein
MKTWSIKVGQRAVSVKALKAQAEALQSAIRNVQQVPQTVRELSGVIGEREHATVLFTPFSLSGTPIVNPEQYEADKNEFFSSIPDFVNAEAIPGIITKARGMCSKHIPVRDNRRTREDDLAQKTEWAQREKEQRESATKARDEFLARYSNGKKINLQPGQTAIVAQLCYDDSDCMTDYYAPHVSLGPALLLAVTGKKARTESDARQAVAKYPEIAELEWKWHEENYSMGHGNYLKAQDGFFELTYDGITKRVGWEVQFERYDKEVYVFRGYQHNTAPARGNGNGIEVRQNEELNGVEVVFPAKPAQEVIDNLKSHGFRWSFKSSLWYKRYSTEAWEFAQALKGA